MLIEDWEVEITLPILIAAFLNIDEDVTVQLFLLLETDTNTF